MSDQGLQAALAGLYIRQYWVGIKDQAFINAVCRIAAVNDAFPDHHQIAFLSRDFHIVNVQMEGTRTDMDDFRLSVPMHGHVVARMLLVYIIIGHGEIARFMLNLFIVIQIMHEWVPLKSCEYHPIFCYYSTIHCGKSMLYYD